MTPSIFNMIQFQTSITVLFLQMVKICQNRSRNCSNQINFVALSVPGFLQGWGLRPLAPRVSTHWLLRRQPWLWIPRWCKSKQVKTSQRIFFRFVTQEQLRDCWERHVMPTNVWTSKCFTHAINNVNILVQLIFILITCECAHHHKSHITTSHSVPNTEVVTNPAMIFANHESLR